MERLWMRVNMKRARTRVEAVVHVSHVLLRLEIELYTDEVQATLRCMLAIAHLHKGSLRDSQTYRRVCLHKV